MKSLNELFRYSIPLSLCRHFKDLPVCFSKNVFTFFNSVNTSLFFIQEPHLAPAGMVIDKDDEVFGFSVRFRAH